MAQAAEAIDPSRSAGLRLVLSAGVIAAIVAWALVSPAGMAGVFDQGLAVVTKNFGWLYL